MQGHKCGTFKLRAHKLGDGCANVGYEAVCGRKGSPSRDGRTTASPA